MFLVYVFCVYACMCVSVCVCVCMCTSEGVCVFKLKTLKKMECNYAKSVSLHLVGV